MRLRESDEVLLGSDRGHCVGGDGWAVIVVVDEQLAGDGSS